MEPSEKTEVRPERHYFGAGVLALLSVAIFVPKTIYGDVETWQLLLLSLLQALLFANAWRKDRAFQRVDEQRKRDAFPELFAAEEAPTTPSVDQDDRR